MIDVFSQIGAVPLTAAGLLAVVVLMILTERLIPWRRHNRQLEHERRRGDEWKAAHDVLADTLKEQAGRDDTVTEMLRTHEHLLRAIQSGTREVQR